MRADLFEVLAWLKSPPEAEAEASYMLYISIFLIPLYAHKLSSFFFEEDEECDFLSETNISCLLLPPGRMHQKRKHTGPVLQKLTTTRPESDPSSDWIPRPALGLGRCLFSTSRPPRHATSPTP